ncbi:hypothetical protein [Stenomitos frigidus]|uniref:Uncharacterized protein n=1 Tax=Stenomitos frigidus ULC18 TaxID=2107698 RepID=A0A2T1DUJ6_9CYAN|nr:hypothetical protein [Stenomitos frigidus]PSB24044.1 hypothetical protein C7B82_28715 [Stenomitos frigidus ULC18]
MTQSPKVPEIIQMPPKEGLLCTVLDLFYMAKQKEFPLKDLKSTLDSLQSFLHSAEGQFREDKDLSDSIKQARESATEASKKLKST